MRSAKWMGGLMMVVVDVARYIKAEFWMGLLGHRSELGGVGSGTAIATHSHCCLAVRPSLAPPGGPAGVHPSTVGSSRKLLRVILLWLIIDIRYSIVSESAK